VVEGTTPRTGRFQKGIENEILKGIAGEAVQTTTEKVGEKSQNAWDQGRNRQRLKRLPGDKRSDEKGGPKTHYHDIKMTKKRAP